MAFQTPAGNEFPTVPPNAIGLVNKEDFGGTLALARRLQPHARRILGALRHRAPGAGARPRRVLPADPVAL